VAQVTACLGQIEVDMANSGNDDASEHHDSVDGLCERRSVTFDWILDEE
jgi:hypothetical protein